MSSQVLCVGRGVRRNSERKKERKKNIADLPNRGLRGKSAKSICDHYLEVMCLTKSQEVVRIHLPPGVEHEVAVVAVEDILEVSGCEYESQLYKCF